MASLYELFDPSQQPSVPRIEQDAIHGLHRVLDRGRHEIGDMAQTVDILNTSVARQSRRMFDAHVERTQTLLKDYGNLVEVLRDAQSQQRLGQDFLEYVRDAWQRAVLTMDTLRKRGDIFLEHEAKGCPPVLAYDYEVVMDAKHLDHPCNYELLRIVPPEGVEILPWKRPYMVIDPRAGHGPGIGGFKADSQVGVALSDGHPVYFVSFRRLPEKGQKLADVTRAEAEFVREIIRRHPEAPKPVVVGNCQGGWATLLLAATHPGLTGPVVINGAPVATWAGQVGTNPMRYNGGVFGGTWIPMFLSDLGGGIFDGAHLVQNFELLNPSRTLFRKYIDLYEKIDEGDAKFLEFETWWGGFFLLAEAEIRWIVEQLFVGNHLVKNEARLEPGRQIDLKQIRAPIIVFASHGDNITPPQQALNWIAETYADEAEIRIRGQRIIYMVHDQVGHLGIFVSSQIAKKEHSEVSSTLKTIEALAPGLYEMHIEEVHGEGKHRSFTVGFVERKLDDIRALDDGQNDEKAFAAVARASEMQAEAYNLFIRPFVKAAITDTAAEMGRALHPQRLSRALMASKNPLMQGVAKAAEHVASERTPASLDNPFIKAQQLWFNAMEQSIDLWRDQRDQLVELCFYGMWATPMGRAFGHSHEARRTLKSAVELGHLPEVTHALAHLERGGLIEGVIRMLVLLAETRGTVRRDRLERSAQVLTRDEPFRSLSGEQRAMIIHEQSLVANYGGERAVTTLAKLLRSPAERDMASRVVRYIVGAIAEMSPDTLSMLQRFHTLLRLPPVTENVLEDPLASVTHEPSNGSGNGASASAHATESLEAIAPAEAQTEEAAMPAISQQEQAVPARSRRVSTRRTTNR